MKIIRFLKNPYKIFSFLATKGCFNTLTDEIYIKYLYRATMGKKLKLKNPQTFNEKLQWLKLYNRKPEYMIMADKYAVREYIANTIGEEYLIPLLGVWDDPDDINFDELPNQFVLKCNHNSGLGMCICKDKTKLDIKQVKNKLKKGIKQNYYLTGREWPYKDVPRKIIAEKYMVDESGEGLNDYKIFCFNGKPRMILVCTDRFSYGGLRENFYDTNWNILEIQRPKHPNTETHIKKPKSLETMLHFAKKLSYKIPFVRVDFYEINGKVYFGEITFFPASGFEKFEPNEWDYTLGSWIDLPNRN